MATAILERLDHKRQEIVALTQDLVRVPTVNPPGDAYQACAEIVGERLRHRGFEVRYLRAEGTPGDTVRHPRVNVVARRESSRPGPCVHFNGHLDVVPAGQGWSVDPWAGEIRDGKVFGRGTCDMKGGLAAAIVAVESLLESDAELPGALEISGTVDEESGGYGGVAWLAEKGFFSPPRVDHVIIPEPLNVDRVCIGHRGVWWAEIETFGRIAHGSMPFLGDCAVRHMAAVVERFERDLWPRLAERRTAMPVVPEGARASTLNLNSIHGGQTEDHSTREIRPPSRKASVLTVPGAPPRTFHSRQRRRIGQHDRDAGPCAGVLGIADQQPGYVAQTVARPGTNHGRTPSSSSVASAMTLADATRSSIRTNSSG